MIGAESQKRVGMSHIEYEFPSNLEATNHRLFPSSLEDDDLVFFHGTKLVNFKAILHGGFIIPDPKGINGLATASFAKQSSMSLGHAMNRRSNYPGEYVVIAVRYEDVNLPHIQINTSDIHDRKLDPQPKVIGYVKIPDSYIHL